MSARDATPEFPECPALIQREKWKWDVAAEPRPCYFLAEGSHDLHQRLSGDKAVGEPDYRDELDCDLEKGSSILRAVI